MRVSTIFVHGVIEFQDVIEITLKRSLASVHLRLDAGGTQDVLKQIPYHRESADFLTLSESGTKVRLDGPIGRNLRRECEGLDR